MANKKMSSISPRRNLPATGRREEIFAVAAELFATHGYHGTSLDDIAARMGVRKTALYHYVKAKEDILIEIYDRMLTDAETRVLPIAQEKLPPDERVRRMVTTYVELLLENSEMWSLVHYQQGVLPEHVRTAFLKRKRGFERRLEEVIREGQEKGLFKAMQPRLLGLAILGMCNFSFYWFKFAKFPTPEITGAFCEIIERGILEDGQKRTGAWPREQRQVDAMSETAAVLTQLQQTMGQLATAFKRDQQRLIDGPTADKRR